MDTEGMSGNGDQDHAPVETEVPERPTPSGWVVVTKATRARKTPAPKQKGLVSLHDHRGKPRRAATSGETRCVLARQHGEVQRMVTR